ncbi:hypothetical protein AZI87_09475 [Bdellovibrio bacteriovorus]|uniref:Uncharacterized protein n=1 Tax=Bdellovibrio bacteriovorus TaxID=959 RepID=A0A162H0X5_BDEBC|nr:hypothetical protein [Bdellovibrio bacteriovorus]KYG69400.1 hypothetical protein AZI87_09475 [Bdellovibrio bacteriovorus]
MLRNLGLVLLISCPIASGAQSMWGTGMWGGMQGCSYQTRAGNGATNQDDETKEIQSAISEAQKQLKTKKSEKKKTDRESERHKADIEKTVSDDYAQFVFEHIENNRQCYEYKGLQEEGEFSAQGQQGSEQLPGTAMTPVHGFTISEWKQYCDPGKAGSVSASICSNSRFKPSEGGRSDANTCKKGLSEYRKSYAKSQKLQREIESLESLIERSKEDLKDAKQNALEEQRERMTAQTEGGICVECMQQGNGGYQYQKPQTDWANVIANVGTGLLATYTGYQQNKMVAEYNSNIGWPTQSYPSWSYGFPYLAAGIYGALGGGTGQGAFGCGNGMGGTGNMNGPMGMMGAYGTGSLYGNMGMGGAFGYPAGMMGNTMGGGIFNGGMGPWGMSGYGGMSGYPMMGMGSMMGMGNMMGGYGSMMGVGGIMGMGNMMGSMMGGYGTMMGSMMSGYPMGSMMGYGNMMGYGTMMGMGSMTGYDSTMLQMQSQYQQQMMQMQMQQYQSMMQYQQQYQSQTLQKYQAVSSLQQEMYNLMSRIQQIQYGYGTTYLGSTSSIGLTSLGTTTGTSILTPLPGSVIGTTGTTSTIIPSSR